MTNNLLLGIDAFQVHGLAGAGMDAATYDPNSLRGDVFDADNHAVDAAPKNYTAASENVEAHLAGIDAALSNTISKSEIVSLNGDTTLSERHKGTSLYCTATLRLTVPFGLGWAAGDQVLIYSKAGVVTVVEDGTTINTLGAKPLIVDTHGFGQLTAEDGADTFVLTAEQEPDQDALFADTPDELTVGYSHAVHDLGTVTSGTVTLDEANGHLQTLVNDGDFTLDPPVEDTTLVLHLTNGANVSAAPTTSNWTLVDGDALDATASNEFLLYVTKIAGISHLVVRALQ